MSKTPQSVRGMPDVLPDDSIKMVAFESSCRQIASGYGYQEVRPPVVEHTELFARGLGETTDVVSKEMYTFPDRKDRSLTLRPELTAGCARAYIQHNLARNEAVTQWFYSGELFRYERMQVGRYRQFRQVGVEAYGVHSPSQDAEVITMLYRMFEGRASYPLNMRLNYVGSGEERENYRAQLVSYFSPHRDALCSDCQRRLEDNPLRILDCKVPSCKALAQNAPSILNSLDDTSKEYFHDVGRLLQETNVPYSIDETCVRGLDYYTGVVFELVIDHPDLASQNTLGAGGRYDNLIEQLGSRATPAIGFAIGVERALLSMKQWNDLPKPDLFLASTPGSPREKAFSLAADLRKEGISVVTEHRHVGFKGQFKRAGKMEARYVIALGENELSSERVNVKNLQTQEETELSLTELSAFIQET